MAEDGEIRIEQTKKVFLEVHVHHHFDEPITVVTIPSYGAVRARIKLSGVEDMANITIDETGEIASVEFEDQKDNVTSAPDGAVATFASSDESVLTVDNSESPMTAKLIPQGVGTASVSVTLTGADGGPLHKPDGSDFDAVEPSEAITVDPGAAVGARLSLSDTTP